MITLAQKKSLPLHRVEDTKEEREQQCQENQIKIKLVAYKSERKLNLKFGGDSNDLQVLDEKTK